VTKKLCSQVGCKTIVDHPDDGTSPRCDKHPRNYTRVNTEERQKKYGHQFDENGKAIYSTYRWKKLRKTKAELNPLCEHCEVFGIAKPVEEVDHKLAIEDGGEIWNINNLQSLCKRCHIVKTRKEEADRRIGVDSWGYRK